ncbi:uncharacterized protein C8A04DRAFT_39391 [Dichotomopilus funicola]|uniref:Uncharacterized protein n=1 Tax=Dichotomopilus funicola TaxID=1934379 RepID=A0AAN6UXM1_9PEZI|nr:hypothetical protein C8A04DRAFT_39391 [Dichotomopilus funicola]
MAPQDVTPERLPAFNPPGWPFVDDNLNAKQKAAWSKQVSTWMQSQITAKDPDDGSPLTGGGGVLRTPLKQFFNGTVTPYITTQPPTTVSWNAFPGLIARQDPNNRWLKVEGHRDLMDEYLEWTTKIDSNKRVQYIVFTCEGFEYFSFLGRENPYGLVDLYRKSNPDFADQIKKEDLLDKDGKYQPYNKWNGVLANIPGQPETGLTSVNPGSIMHLAQVNNTLSAEVDIAGQATVLRKNPDGQPITDQTTLCNCSKYGNAYRNSDPTIGIGVNTLARNGNLISVADPVAIYMVEFNTANFRLDVDGSSQDLQDIPDGTFTWVRGDINKKMGLRLKVEIPKGTMGTGQNEGRELTVSDIFDTNTSKYIEFGGQFADYVTMGVSAVVIKGDNAAPAEFCPAVPKPKDGDHEGIDGLAVGAGPKKTPQGLHTARRL